MLMKDKNNEPPHDKTNKMSARPANTQISLGIRPVWSESSLWAQRVAKDQSILHADSEDSDQTGRMPRLIWVFTGRTCHFVGFVMRRLKCKPFSFDSLMIMIRYCYSNCACVPVEELRADCFRELWIKDAEFFFFFKDVFQQP